jgi:hypothetical protein
LGFSTIDRTEVLLHHLGSHAAVVLDVLPGDLEDSHHGPAVTVVDLEHRLQQLRVVNHDVVAEEDRERLGADMLAGHRHRVTEAQRVALADVVDVCHLGDGLHLLELLVLLALLQVELELEVAVEVVLDGPLAPTGDDEDVGDAGADRFLHHVLDGGFVDDRHHLLRLALGGREESRPQPGGRDHCLPHLGHQPVLRIIGFASSIRLRPFSLARFRASWAAASNVRTLVPLWG